MVTPPDLTQLRLKSIPSQPQDRRRTRLPRHKPGEKFLKGPIPWKWLTRAAQQRGRALHVALGLWFWAGIKGSGQVALSISRLSTLGVNRFAAYRGLAALERVGLVAVHRQRGRKPIVTILEG